MTRKRLLLVSLLGFAALAIAVPAGRFVHSGWRSRSAVSASPRKEAAPSHASLLSNYGNLPLTFEENHGQTDARVKFLARGSGYTVFLTNDETATFRLSAPEKDAASPRDRVLARLTNKSAHSAEPPAPDAVVRVALVGANPRAQVEGNELQPGKSNYFIGNNPSRWQTNVPHYARVKYHRVYPGIDLVYYGNQRQLESDYIVAPGADPSQIALRIDGARPKINSQGDLLLATSTGEVVLQKPRAYQQISGERSQIATNYIQRGSHFIGLRLAPYDTREPLIIDPALVYSTYLGGSGTDATLGIAVDATANAYVTGNTTSTDFPTFPNPGAFQNTFPIPAPIPTGARVSFVTKLNPAGTALVYSTFLGGTTSSAADGAAAIAIDSAGDAFVTGTTGANDFPVTPGKAYQSTNAGNTGGAVFVTELNPTGSSLVYSTYLAGNGSDSGLGIAVDSTGVAYVTGSTTSGNFPVILATAIQGVNNSLSGTAFVSKINPNITGTGSLVYSTYLGGSGFESGASIAVDPVTSGVVYFTGFTGSTDFPVTPSAFQNALALNNLSTDAFVSKIDTTTSGATGLLYSTYLGGSGTGGRNGSGDRGNAIAVDASANAYVVGITGSTNFPLSATPYQNTNKGVSTINGFVTRMDTTKSGLASLVYSTYLGGAGNDESVGIAIDSQKNAYITGETTSGANTFPPSAGAPQANNNGTENAYIFVLDPTGSSQLFSTFWGGTAIDIGFGIALDTASPPNIYITGTTKSSQLFPLSNPTFQNSLKGAKNGFVSKLSGLSGAAGGVTVAPTSLDFGSQTVSTASAPLSVTLTNGSSATITISSIAISGTNASDFSQTASSTPCGATLAAGANCTVSVIFTPAASGTRSGNLVITDTVDPSSPHTVALTGSGTPPGTPDFSISLAPANASIASGGKVTVTVTVTSLTGFNSAVALTCTGAPQSSSCVLNPTSVTPAANGTITSTATITTTKFGAAPVPFSIRLHAPRPFPVVGLLCLLVAVLMAWIAARRGARRLAFGFALLSLLSLTSCSGPLPPGTPPNTYPLTITGKSGSLTHPASFSLTVT